MAWITLSESDLATAITGPELNAVKTAALRSGQDDPVAAELAQVTREVRGRVKACNCNTLGAAGTIPDECKTATIDICVYRLAKRLPAGVLNPTREKANDQALAFLRDVAACDVVLEQPESGTESDEISSSPPVPRICRPMRRFDRCDQDGI